MAQYLLPKSDQTRVPELLCNGGEVTFGWMDDGLLEIDGARWWRFTCSSGNSSVVGSIGDHQELPEMIVVSIGLDLRRLPLIWRLFTDLRLVRRLNRLLEEAGAAQLRDED